MKFQKGNVYKVCSSVPGTEVLKVIIFIIAIIVQFFEEKRIIALEIKDFSVEGIAFVPIASF